MTRIKYKETVGLDVKPGRQSLGDKPDKNVLRRLYVRDSKSIREVAEILGCSKDMIYRSLKEYGIERRAKVKRSQLRAYKPSFLKRVIGKRGFRQVATELRVGITTLRDYMKVNR